MVQIDVSEKILGTNDEIALQVRQMLDERGLLGLNLMGSPGAGKTSVILATAGTLAGRLQLAVIEGDIASRVDADKVAAAGIPVHQINTGGMCHLDAAMVRGALNQLETTDAQLLFIENVGNLVCPNEFVLGAHRRVLIASVPEGDDKPYKYPAMFQDTDAVVLNKMDLSPYVDFDLEAYQRLLLALNPDAAVFPVSCKTGEGIAEWVEWLVQEQAFAAAMREQKRKAAQMEKMAQC
jgi:hydrogenase nickel incorporation protein HypB